MKGLKGISALLALVSLCALAPRSGLACSCLAATLDEHVDRAHRIFIGHLVEARILPPKTAAGAADSMPEWGRIEAIFEPRYPIRGEFGDREAFRTGLGGGDCGVRMEVGAFYMIFLDEGDSRIDICSGSRQIDRYESKEMAERLESLLD